MDVTRAGDSTDPAPVPTPAQVVAALRGAGCVWAEDEARLLVEGFTGPALGDAVRRRVSGEPLEHVLGWGRFCGLRIAVWAPVFVPRTRAEPLARAAVAEVLARPGGAVVVDLGCGSGAIAATVAARAPAGTEVWATDVTAEATSCARVNAATYGFRVVRGDWFTGLPTALTGRVDVVVGYLPHVPDVRLADIPADHRAAEQDAAVCGGPDGLDPLRAVLTQLARWLGPGGVLVTMVAAEQADDARAAVRAAGWSGALAGEPEQESPVLSVRRALGPSG